MKINVSLEVECESVAAAVSTVLYAIDCEGGEIEVLEVSASPSYIAETSTEVVHNSTTNITNCTHEDQDVHLDAEQIKSKGRALPATLS